MIPSHLPYAVMSEEFWSVRIRHSLLRIFPSPGSVHNGFLLVKKAKEKDDDTIE